MQLEREDCSTSTGGKVGGGGPTTGPPGRGIGPQGERDRPGPDRVRQPDPEGDRPLYL